jgi:phage tail sheath protein FI
MQTFLNPIGVDCLRPFNGRGLRVFGARTLSSDPSWRFVNVRRLVSMIEHALLFATQWVVFEPNDIYLRHSVRASIAGFLETIWKQGGLAGKAVDEAFFVICDDTNNSAAMIANGQLVADIGVAPTIPAEFVIFRIGSTADSLEVTE